MIVARLTWAMAFALAGMAALAGNAAAQCSCADMPDPMEQRRSAAIILVGEVSKIETLPGTLADMSRATIRVARVLRSNGHLAGFVRVDSLNEGTCGYPFRVGERREFLIRRTGGRFTTTRCLMFGARDEEMIRETE